MKHKHNEHLKKSEINTNIEYNDGIISIELKDGFNNPPKLEIMHEKEMHFIIVSNNLKTYLHLHPEKKQEGLFIIKQQLEPGTYQAFVDVTPEYFDYVVSPIELQIGEKMTPKISLQTDDSWVKKIEGEQVELKAVSAEIGGHTPLEFITFSKPQNHLGALGHVIIFDEALTTYIHVHPESHESTTFYAHFPKTGIYKIFAEFKFNNQVYRFTFNIEVKE